MGFIVRCISLSVILLLQCHISVAQQQFKDSSKGSESIVVKKNVQDVDAEQRIQDRNYLPDVIRSNNSTSIVKERIPSSNLSLPKRNIPEEIKALEKRIEIAKALPEELYSQAFVNKLSHALQLKRVELYSLTNEVNYKK